MDEPEVEELEAFRKGMVELPWLDTPERWVCPRIWDELDESMSSFTSPLRWVCPRIWDELDESASSFTSPLRWVWGTTPGSCPVGSSHSTCRGLGKQREICGNCGLEVKALGRGRNSPRSVPTRRRGGGCDTWDSLGLSLPWELQKFQEGPWEEEPDPEPPPRNSLGAKSWEFLCFALRRVEPRGEGLGWGARGARSSSGKLKSTLGTLQVEPKPFRWSQNPSDGIKTLQVESEPFRWRNQNSSGGSKTLQMEPEPFRWSQNSSDGAKTLQMEPKPFRWSQNPSDGTKTLQMEPKSFRWNQNSSDGSKILQVESEPFRWSQNPSNGIKNLQVEPKPFRWSQNPSNGIKNLQVEPKPFRWSQNSSDGVNRH
ncbi:uncharacterized protein LOC127464118 isoform X23 [Manacus candei]|uniref:uncharacterized protein LOC127464118 isoform X23 n=1 Tax=Manacus candei TaxID=415023 RepID=UPI00222634A9|nr:uncharacterized protein LOC127464118 isoform X23 [Manacus candei]